MKVLVPRTHPDWISGMERLDYAFFDIGPIRNDTDATSWDLATGLNGWLGEWQWHASAAHHRNAVTSRTGGLVRELQIDAVVTEDIAAPEEQDEVLALRAALREVQDIARLGSRIVLGYAGPRELLALKQSLSVLPEIASRLAGNPTPAQDIDGKSDVLNGAPHST